jgi:hypothetical protein
MLFGTSPSSFPFSRTHVHSVSSRLSVIEDTSQYSGHMPFPVDSLNWALVATVPAMSTIHRDAGKFATYVQVQSGTKLWLVRDPEESPGLPHKLVETDVKQHKWTGFVLNPGHVL